MAITRCKHCGRKRDVGCMPTASCGVLAILGIVCGACFASTVVGVVLSQNPSWPRDAVRVGACVLGGIMGLFGIHYVPWTVEWLIAMCRPCPDCGKRRWSYPFTEGFGL